MNERELRQRLNRLIGQSIHNVVLGVQTRDGRVDFAEAAGVANARAGTPMTIDTPYLIASVTKMYTAAVILMLHQERRIELDAEISRYLPAELLRGIHVLDGRDFSSEITVFQLVNQTSGLADYFQDKPRGGRSLFEELVSGHDRAVRFPDVLEIVRRLKPKFAPGAKGGKKAAYSDTNYQLLGQIIAEVTGKPVAESFQERIFEPLGLRNTFVYDPTDPRLEALADVYLGKGALQLPEFLSSHTSDGGIVSTVSESLAFLRAFFEGRLFDERHFPRMTSQWNRIFFPMQYGYGMMRVGLPKIFFLFRPMPELIGHAGSTGSFAFYNAKKSLTIAGTVNQINAPAASIRLMMQVVSAID